MSDKEFFSISGLGVAMHTSETKKIWQSWENCDCSKSDMGRKAMLEFANDMGFNGGTEENNLLEVAKEALGYLLQQFPSVSGMRSYILREAIINYS